MEEATSTNTQDVFKFMDLLNNLKHASRMGWKNRNIENHERVAGHMYAMAMMTFLINDDLGVNRIRCMELALVHDLAESIVGDITPQDNVSSDVKHQMELDAMKQIISHLDKESGSRIMDLYQEYEAKATPEAKFVKDLDYFDMLYTANWYEKRDNKKVDLQEFFDSTKGKFTTNFVKKMAEDLEEQRKCDCE